jgi:WD40 repeat protein
MKNRSPKNNLIPREDTQKELMDVSTLKNIGINIPIKHTIHTAHNNHVGNINCVDISPCGKYAATAGSDQTAMLWD